MAFGCDVDSMGLLTNILLGDGVRPSVVAKHLIGQANDAMPFNVTNLPKVGERFM